MTLPITFIEATEVWLELSSTSLESRFSSAGSAWNATLNQSCLEAILAWLQEDYEANPRPFPNLAALPSYWEFVNGTPIEMNNTRFLIVPSEAMDLSEMRIPQEWVDIPNWIADYYLAVQVNPDDESLRIWGYTTHKNLKDKGNYNRSDRTYSLSQANLIPDINILWVSQELCPSEETRAAVSPLPNLSLERANNLLERLGNSDLMLPRLVLSFEDWGALLSHSGWRKQLYQRRIGQSPWSILDWLQQGVSEFAQQFGWQKMEMQPSLIGARGIEEATTSSLIIRQLSIAGQPYELRIIPSGNQEENVWRFELRSSLASGLIPGGFKLRLLTEDLQPFENNEDTAEAAVELLYVEVALESGEGLVWEVEPIPNNYEREILRF